MRRRIHECNTGMSGRTCIHASIRVRSARYMYTQGSQERTDTHADAEREGEKRENTATEMDREGERKTETRERERENDRLFELGGVSLFGLL